MNAIGAPLTRVDGPAKVTGSARYAAEFHPDGLAYAATHDSTVAAGRITAIDTAAAERAPGVLLVLTHLNADRLPYQTPAERPAVDPVAGEQLRVLQDAEVLFSGQPIALVLGNDAVAGSLCGFAHSRDLRRRSRAPHSLRSRVRQANLRGCRQEGTRSRYQKGRPRYRLRRCASSCRCKLRAGAREHNAMERMPP